MKNNIRAFIAVNLSHEIRRSVASLVRSLQDKVDGTKWVEAQNLHVTLKFLGDVPLNDLHALIGTLSGVTRKTEAFDLEFVGCGAFPDPKTPKTIWIGCRRGAEELTRLATDIEEALFQLGYPKESRRFSPHLTIGRVKKSSPFSDDALAQWFASRNDSVRSAPAISTKSSSIPANGRVEDRFTMNWRSFR